MKIWDLTEQTLIDKQAFQTADEIYRQPEVWQLVYERILASSDQIKEFFVQAISRQNLQIILTGAGSSAFIGLSLQGAYRRRLGKFTLSIPTTDLVTHPFDYFLPDVPLLLVSFARSGNSPESVAAAELADSLCRQVTHFIITCDPEGKLARYETSSEKFMLVLPSQANDQGLAMTGSYSGMLLAGLLIARIGEIDQLAETMKSLVRYGSRLTRHYSEDFRHIAELSFQRAVFLGSGPLAGTATESQLKLQELTDGRIICKNDSFLGIRHGPRAVIDETTLVFYLFSNHPYVAKYEMDLAASIKTARKPLFEAGLIEKWHPHMKTDQLFVLSEKGEHVDEEFLPVCSIIPAQMLGFFKSLSLGLHPDSPSLSGSISRVVQGVNIYSFDK